MDQGSEPNLHVEIPVDNVARFVLGFANQNGVRALRTKLDEFAEAFTRLGGDEVRLDRIEQTIVELRERNLVSDDQMNDLLFNYMREKCRQSPAGS